MISRMKLGFAAGALTLAFGAGLAIAAMAPDDAIKARKGCMKAHGAVMGAGVKVMKGEAKFDAAAMKALYDAEDAACKDWAMWWGEDTMKGDKEKTGALPAIWKDPKGFEAAGGKWYEAATKLRASADEAAFKAAFPAVGAGCKGCHENFRAPTN